MLFWTVKRSSSVQVMTPLISNLTDTTWMQARKQLHLSEFNFDISHWVAAKNHTADALFRLQTGGADGIEPDDELHVAEL